MTEARRPDSLTVEGPVRWTFDKRGLVGAWLGDFQVISGSFEPKMWDWVFDRDEKVSEKAGELKSAKFSSRGDNCRIVQTYEHVIAEQFWNVDDEDAHCEVVVWNDGDVPIRYPGFGDLVCHWPTTPAGIATDLGWTVQQMQALGPQWFLIPNEWIVIRASYLADATVGVGYSPIGLGNDKHYPWWEPVWQTPNYTSRWFHPIWPRAIAPGESATFEFVLRVSADVRPEHLLEPYRNGLVRDSTREKAVRLRMGTGGDNGATVQTVEQ